MSTTSADVVIVGGGHNALVAAAYLAGAGYAVAVLEGRDRFGGAVASGSPFPGVSVRLSRYSYLVSLLPNTITDDLGLDVELRSRPVASYSPYGDSGLLVEQSAGRATEESFTALTGDGRDYAAWLAFHDRIGQAGEIIAPTLTEPLPTTSTMRTRLGDELMDDLAVRPIGELLTQTFTDDVVRGTVATDALIGTEAGLSDHSLAQNRCFLYHVIGNGTGEWRVPVGGMGRVSDTLEQAARTRGAKLITNTCVRSLSRANDRWIASTQDGQDWEAPTVLADCAQATLAQLLGTSAASPEGNQVKINMVVHRLPRFRSQISPEVDFAGTLHLHQGYQELTAAHASASRGELPDPLPCEVYCHSLTDPSILDPQLAAAGWHTLTLFGLHTPARLFDADPDGMRDAARSAALHSLQDALAEPLTDCLATDAAGDPCVEVLTPHDVEAELGMPGGHIFHGGFDWPWHADDEPAQSAAERWGVATGHPGLLLCGASSRRGGGVSGLGGHSAAMAVLDA